MSTDTVISPPVVGEQVRDPRSAPRFNPREVSSVSAKDANSAIVWLAPILVGVGLWAVMRAVFFMGLEGSDDLFHMRYAALWGRPPVNHWEARLVTNVLIAAGMKALGAVPLAGIWPCLASSLTILGCIYYWCWQYATPRHAWWAGMLAAVMPLDVHCATIVSAYPIMTAFMAVGTLAFIEAPDSRRARWLAAAALAFGTVIHLYGFYYIACLTTAAMIVDRRRFLRPVAAAFVAGVLVFAVDMAVFHVLTGSPLGRFRILAASHLGTDDAFGYPAFDRLFLLEPLGRLLLNKGLGTVLAVALMWGLWHYRREAGPNRILILTSLLFWLWFNYGSQVPWQYRPFWRLDRYACPQVLPAVILCAGALVGARPWLRRLGGAVLAGTCVLLLSASGSWGQSVPISRDMLDYIRAHPQQRFLTDFHTANELYVLNGMSTPPNVVTSDGCPVRHLLDAETPRVSAANPAGYDFVLDNPLNSSSDRAPDFAAFLARSDRRFRVLHATQPAYRTICRMMPKLRAQSWAVRRPAAHVLAPIDSK